MKTRPVKYLVRVLVVVSMLAGLAGLSGCVTTVTDPVFGQKVSKKKAVDSYVQAALDYLRRGDAQNAERHLKKALALDKDSPKVHHALALAFEMDGEYELARKQFKEALRLDPNFTQARNNYAAFLFRRGEYKKSCEEMRKVTLDTLYDNRTAAFANLGICEQKLGEPGAAKAAFKRAVAMDHTYTPALIELAAIDLQQGNFTEAQNYYDDYRSLTKQNARSLWIGIQLADHFGDKNAFASYALALRNLYPHSPEYQAYRKKYANE